MMKSNREAAAVAAILGLLTTAGGLVVYKAASAMQVLATAQTDRALAAKARWIDAAGTGAARPLVETLNYAAWIAVALTLGILIAAVVRAFVPERWLERTIAVDGLRGQVFAAFVGAPLMLCSCCVAPIFEGVYVRTRRLGPALAMMLAAPGLNPAVIAVTFLIFPAATAGLRLGAALFLVIFAAGVLGRAYPDPRVAEACPIDRAAPGFRTFVRAFGSSLATVAWRSLPVIAIGVLASMAIAGVVPIERVAGSVHPAAVVVIVAALAVPLALPTFGEIPLALALLAAGAPEGAAAALLVAGPTVNLPSLLALARATSWRVAAATAGAVFAVAVVVGLAALALA